MPDEKDKDEILLQYLLGELSPEVCKRVEQWKAENPANRRYFENFRQAHLSLQQTVRYEVIRGNYPPFRTRLRRRRSLHRWSRIAAVVVLFLGAAGSLYRIYTPSYENLTIANSTILPGSSQAILHLSSGQIIRLNNNGQTLREQDGTTIDVREAGQLSYSPASSEKTVTLTNRLEIPRGGEFRLTLSDSTEIWLNAETELQYPTVFSGAERRVRLNGEAYFKIAKNPGHPFIVETGNLKIKVYGTQFNINTQTQGKIETVLVNGSVSLIHENQEIRLKPDQKAEFIPATGKTDITTVNVLPYIAWKEGNFMFQNESLEIIMEKLSRWYDLNVFYLNHNAKHIRLSGMLKRYDNVTELFRYFEKISDVRFTVKGKTVTIK